MKGVFHRWHAPLFKVYAFCLIGLFITPHSAFGFDPQNFRHRISEMHKNISTYHSSGGNMAPVQQKVKVLEKRINSQNFIEAEKVLAEIEGILTTNHSLPQSTCREILKDLEYHCKYHPIKKSHHILLSQYKVLLTANLDTKKKAIVLSAPEGWGIGQNSISPDHKHLLLTMDRQDCNRDRNNHNGRLCGWGKSVLWLATINKAKKYWVLRNLSPIYGFNADIHGWTSWQTNRHAFFNGKIQKEGLPLLGTSQGDNNAQAYQVKISAKGTVEIDLWSKTLLYREDCLTGRLFASHPQNSNLCKDGAKAVFTRRCYSDPKNDENFAWWNTRNMDGTGGFCTQDIQAKMPVPILRVYVTEVDKDCQAKSKFADMKPVQAPRRTGHFRQMSKHVPEWGDMQSAISPDGKQVAFHTVKGHLSVSAQNNCGSFQGDGHAASRVYMCSLNDANTCSEPSEIASVPTNPRVDQGMPHFVGNSLLIIEGGGGQPPEIVRVKAGKREPLFMGIGGYPLN